MSALNPTTRFSDRAADYANYRPSYPAAAIDAVLEGMGEPSLLVCADIGAGTGISSRLLADRGVRVIGIEPNRAMREAATPHGLVEMREGTAEQTGLGDASVDLVVCAQAFHWTRPVEALAEFARILKPGGRVVLMWNDYDPDATGFTADFRKAMFEATGKTRSVAEPYQDEYLRQSMLFINPRQLSFPFLQELDEAGVIGRARSASYCPKEGEGWEKLRDNLLLAQERWARDGLAELKYVTSVYVAERVLDIPE